MLFKDKVYLCSGEIVRFFKSYTNVDVSEIVKISFQKIWDITENPDRLWSRRKNNPIEEYTIWEKLLTVTFLSLKFIFFTSSHYFEEKWLSNWFIPSKATVGFQLRIDAAMHFKIGYQTYTLPLKAVDTIGNCQRLAFTVGVSQHMHKISNLWKFELNRSSNLRDNNERKKHPSHTK